MKKLLSKIVTVVISVICAITTAVAPPSNPTQPPVTEPDSPSVVEETKDNTDTNENSSLEIVEDKATDNADETAQAEPETKEEQPAENALTEDANTNTDAENSNLPETENDAEVPAEDEYADYEVIETIDISATEEDDVTLTLYAAPSQAEDEAIEENEIAVSTISAAPRMARQRNAAAPAALSLDEDVADNTNEVTTGTNLEIKEVENARSGELNVIARITGSGDMEDDVYRHFIDNGKYVETVKKLLADGYSISVDDIDCDLPDSDDFFEIDANAVFYLNKDCAAGAEGTILETTDEMVEQLDPADLLGVAVNSVFIENDITSISAGAFLFCKDLRSVEIPPTVTSIGSSAFAYCSNLTEVVLPEGLIRIGSEAFMQCTSLEEIIIPSTVTTIDMDAFTFMKEGSRVICPTAQIFDLVQNHYRVTPERTTVQLKENN